MHVITLKLVTVCVHIETTTAEGGHPTAVNHLIAKHFVAAEVVRLRRRGDKVRILKNPATEQG